VRVIHSRKCSGMFFYSPRYTRDSTTTQTRQGRCYARHARAVLISTSTRWFDTDCHEVKRKNAQTGTQVPLSVNKRRYGSLASTVQEADTPVPAEVHSVLLHHCRRLHADSIRVNYGTPLTTCFNGQNSNRRRNWHLSTSHSLSETQYNIRESTAAVPPPRHQNQCPTARSLLYVTAFIFTHHKGSENT